jgi:hypothetical protein
LGAIPEYLIDSELGISLTNGKTHGPGGAAEMLALNPSTLRAKMRKHGIAFGRANYA